MEKIVKAVSVADALGDHVPAFKKLWENEDNKENHHDDLFKRIAKLRTQFMRLVNVTEERSGRIHGRKKMLLVAHRFVIRAFASGSVAPDKRKSFLKKFDPFNTQMIPYEIRPADYNDDQIFGLIRLENFEPN